MSVPNLGVTQLIQQPGVGGTFAQGLAGVLQARMARQEAERQRLYAEAQMQSIKNAQDERERELKDREAIGTSLARLLNPQQVSLDIPMAAPNVVGGAPANGLRPMVDVMEDASGQIQTRGPITSPPPAGAPLQVRGTRERPYEEVLAELASERPSAVSGFVEQARPELERRQKAAKEKANLRALEKIINDPNTPKGVRGAMAFDLQLAQAGVEPFQRVSLMQMFGELFKPNNDEDKKKDADFYRKWRPGMFEGLSDDTVKRLGDQAYVKAVAESIKPSGLSAEQRRKRYLSERQAVYAEYREKIGKAKSQRERDELELAAGHKVSSLAIKYDQPPEPYVPPQPPENTFGLSELLQSVGIGTQQTTPSNPEPMVPRAGGR